MKVVLTVLLIGLCASVSAAEPLSRIAFGSCNKHDVPQPIWKSVVAFQPQLWIWLGDNIYGDTTDMAVLAKKWKAQKEHADYRELLTACPVVGTWDDHDYGANDGGADYPMKRESRQLFLDFLDVPAGDVRRSRDGVYDAKVFGSEGMRVCVITLDVRTHREAPRTDGDILGETQWKWVAETLRESTARVHIIASGTQILSSEHRFEKWADYPRSRQRLLDLIRDLRVSGVIFLSGDRHIGEISWLDATPPIFEVTSSGLTHSFKNFKNEPNGLRVGEVFAGLNFGTIEIDWTSGAVTLAVRDDAGRPVRSVTTSLSEIAP